MRYESIYPMSVASRDVGDVAGRAPASSRCAARSCGCATRAPRTRRRLFGLASDPEVTRFFSWGPYREQSEAAAYIASLAPQARRRASGSSS